MLKGRLASGFCSPTLTWAQAAAQERSSAALAYFIVILLASFLRKCKTVQVFPAFLSATAFMQ
jgi:hypothetical protein